MAHWKSGSTRRGGTRGGRVSGAGALVVVLSAAAPVPAAAEVYTGRELLSDCRAMPAGASEGTCFGWAEWMTMSPRFCPPGRLAPAEVVETLIAWLETHPGKLHMPGGALVHEAMFERFPCGK